MKLLFVDCCISHAAIDENGYVSTWTKDGNQYLICKHGIKALKRRDNLELCVTTHSKSEINGNYLIRGEIDDVKVRYFKGEKDNAEAKSEIEKILSTSYVQNLF